jgi:hypothetical protein
VPPCEALTHDAVRKLLAVGRELVSQEAARVIVRPRAAEPGFWFGGGNACRDRDGALLICGRYRNGGDSRVGIEAGPRGAELAVLRSEDDGATFEPFVSLLKADVAPPCEHVLSIEGSCLRVTPDGIELYVSSEKRRGYPEHLAESQKPGTGIWSIDALRAADAEGLARATPELVLRSADGPWLHVKDPYLMRVGGRELLGYCSHPHNWTSTNPGVAAFTPGGGVSDLSHALLARGPVWDVAVTRLTACLPLPSAGALACLPPLSLCFYDGAECMHNHAGGGRPRGYSCEEIGGLAVASSGQGGPPELVRLTVDAPLFVSPHATGCSRYVSVLEDGDSYLATWQQAQADGSQPLVAHRVARDRLLELLA